MRIKVVNTHAIRKVVPYTGVIVKTEPAPAPDEDVPFLLPRKDGKTWIKVIYPSEYVMNKEFVIYLSSAKGYPVYVDWGDGTAIYQTTSTSRDNVTHSYENPGIYYISIWSDGEYHLGYTNNPCITPNSYVLELEIGKNVVLLQSAFTNATRLLAIYNNAENIWRPHDIGQFLFQGRLSPVVKLLGLKLDGTGSSRGAYMFRNSSVVSITVGEYVTGLPTGLCYGDTSLREFNATENLKMIGASAFNGCTGLVNVLLPSKEVVTLSSVSAFANVPETCKIRVPEELVDSYKTATNWSEFAEQICAIEAVPEEGSDAR